jgi:hypothetical protein
VNRNWPGCRGPEQHLNITSRLRPKIGEARHRSSPCAEGRRTVEAITCTRLPGRLLDADQVPPLRQQRPRRQQLGPAKLLPGMPATAAYRTGSTPWPGSCASSRIARIFGAPVVHHRGRDARSRRGGPGAAHGRPTPAARRPTPRRHPRTGRPARSHHDRTAARLTYPDARNMHVRKALSSAHSLISWSTSYLMPAK